MNRHALWPRTTAQQQSFVGARACSETHGRAFLTASVYNTPPRALSFPRHRQERSVIGRKSQAVRSSHVARPVDPVLEEALSVTRGSLPVPDHGIGLFRRNVTENTTKMKGFMVRVRTAYAMMR
jgi:hypothetical protein